MTLLIVVSMPFWHPKPHPVRSHQFFEQGSGLQQVGHVKPLGEPAVDLRQQLVGCCALALRLPQPAQAHGGAQFEGLRLLLAGKGAGLLKACLSVWRLESGRQTLASRL